MKRLAATALAALAATLTFGSSAQADRGFDKSASPDRDGLTMGASFGRGSIDVKCGSCDGGSLKEALSVAAHVGYMVTPRIGILAEYWTVRYNARGGAIFDDSARHLVAQNMSMIAAQLFVSDSIWLKAGMGVGWHITDGNYAKEPRMTGPVQAAGGQGQMRPTDSESTTLGAASFFAIGWEMAHNTIFAADIQFRIGTTKRPDERFEILNTGLNVGFNWY